MAPRVSIVVPSLNHRAFLDDRVGSIRAQTFPDWEALVIDGGSTDGAREYFEDVARTDARFRVIREASPGIYAAINQAVALAEGAYVYVAPSDDSMEPGLLEAMVAGLDAHPSCELAHCKLRITGRDGGDSPSKDWDSFFVVRYFGPLLDRMHVRRAPHDALLHYAGISVYTSLTQLLIRRRLFDRIGGFPTDVGSVGDFEWTLRATLVADTLHVPGRFATWRVHDEQATSDERLVHARAAGTFLRLASRATRAARRIAPHAARLDTSSLTEAMRRDQLALQMSRARSDAGRRWVTLMWAVKDRAVLQAYRQAAASGEDFVSQEWILAFLRRQVQAHGLDGALVATEPRPVAGGAA